ncbi:MAG: hypothetical protein ABL886_15175 [Rhodoglobus sp.]
MDGVPVNRFSDDEFWSLRVRGAAINMFVDSCFHLVHSSDVLKEADAKNFSSDLRAGLGGIAVKFLSLARTERPNEIPIHFSNHSADGFVVRIELEKPEFPQAFFAAFALDVRFESQRLAFRISKSSLESLLADWLARGRPPSDPRRRQVQDPEG